MIYIEYDGESQDLYLPRGGSSAAATSYELGYESGYTAGYEAGYEAAQE